MFNDNMAPRFEKKTSNRNWYTTPSINLKKAFYLMLSCYAFLAVAFLLGANTFVYNRVIHPLIFSIRGYVGMSPQLDPRIKIFAADHRTMAELGVAAIPAEEWISLFKALAKAKPRAIFIDTSLPIPLSRDPKMKRLFVEQVIKTRPIAAGSFFVTNRIVGFDEITEIDSDLDFNSLPWLKWDSGYFYGPEPSLRNAFSQVGHTNYEGFGYIKPLLKAGELRIMPFWGLNLLGKLSAKEGTLYTNSNPIPVNPNGELLVNLAPAGDYWKRTFSLVTPLRKARAQKPLDEVTSSDVVLILTDMVQGATGFKETPAGVMPGGFILVEVVNSVLRNTWLKSFGGELLYTLLFCIFGMFLAVSLSAVPFAGVLVLVELIFFSIGIGSFCFYGLLLPWAFPAIGFFTSGLLIFSERVRVSEVRSQQMRFSLEGVIGPAKLNSLLSQNIDSWLEPKSQVLTVMFIDIVGFSMTAEEEKPVVIFRQLRGLLSEISEIVHDCFGVVDKSLGDGLLCFFGYQFDGSTTIDNQHAKQALDCAVRIQQAAVQRNLKNELATPFFPIRIGINTGEVYVGDLGGSRRIDITVIGHSVNYGRRLESAFEIYRVMVGATTWDHLNVPAGSIGYTKKQIPIKHQEELGEAYEFNPFHSEPEQLNEALLRYRQIARLNRQEERFPVDPILGYKFQSNIGHGVITDFSRSGMSILLDNYFVKSTELKFTISSENGNLQKACSRKSIREVSGVVRWARPDKDGFRHGIFFNKLNSEQKENLLYCFRAGQSTTSGI